MADVLAFEADDDDDDELDEEDDDEEVDDDEEDEESVALATDDVTSALCWNIMSLDIVLLSMTNEL